MPTKSTKQSEEIYQIKVTLLGTKPPIWRRLLVPASFTLAQLHDVLQVAMGWDDGHLHEFRIGEEVYGTPDPDAEPTVNESTVRLSKVLGTVGAKALYNYDFGDDWKHEIKVEKILPPAAGQAYPICVAGKLHGPPEDCGGVFGFYNLLEILADPKHDEHEEMQDWLGDEFDPEAFSLEEINRRLAYLAAAIRAVNARPIQP